MANLLKEVYKLKGEFVPFAMRKKFPDDFRKIIQAQIKLIANQHVIVLNHIGDAAMYYLSDHIMAVEGVKMLLPARTLESYRVLVNTSDFERVREHLRRYIPALYEQYVEPDARPHPERYTGPPQVSPIG